MMVTCRRRSVMFSWPCFVMHKCFRKLVSIREVITSLEGTNFRIMEKNWRVSHDLGINFASLFKTLKLRVASFNSLPHFNFLRTRVTTKTPCAGAIIHFNGYVETWSEYKSKYNAKVIYKSPQRFFLEIYVAR